MIDRHPGRQWLAETKFHRPMLPGDAIPRPHLLQDLHNRLLSHPLTLLSAPAGYGKTTLLATLPAAYPALPLAWLSLDEEDNDPARFLTALIVALQHLNPNYGAIAASLLRGRGGGAVAVRPVTSVLINEILETLVRPFALILDDLHRITEPAIFVALDYLLEHRPPQLHVVVGTRVDPPLALARLRAQGAVSELRLAELRFSDQEASTFLSDRLDLGLAPGEVASLQSRAEGWPAGLRLLASSLDRARAAEQRTLLIHHLAQIDRDIFDFLAEEVLYRQEEEIRTFLLETAILPELTPTLCRAVTRRADAVTMLEELYRRNLFLTRVAPFTEEADAGRGGPRSASRLPHNIPSAESQYRYHDLFATFLRHKLQAQWPDRLPELHLRAAEAENNPMHAVGHYLAAARWQEAAALIEQIGAGLFALGYLDTLSRWINTLPASVRDNHPRLLQYVGDIALWRGTWNEARALLQRALEGFAASRNEAGQGEVLTTLAVIATWPKADAQQGGALFDRALMHPAPPQIRLQALLGRASLKLAWGDWAQAERDFEAAMALIDRLDQLDLFELLALPTLDPGFAFLPGGLEQLQRIYRAANDQVNGQISPLRLIVEEMNTVLHLFRGELAEAIKAGQNALALRERLGGHPILGVDAALFLMIAHTMLGHYRAIEPLFDLLFLGADPAGQPPPDFAYFLFDAGRARWLQGRLPEAREIYAQMCAVADPAREVPAAGISRTWMYSMLEMAAGRYREAERALRQPETLAQKDRYSTIGGNTRLMLARLYLQENRHQEALAELEPALAYHEQLGLPFTILLEGQSIVPLLRMAVKRGVYDTYAAHLLTLLGATSKPQPFKIPQSGARLTPREVEVLQWIARGASNRMIAERLTITESTVKTHAYHIFAKLDVSNRTQAAARARELRIV